MRVTTSVLSARMKSLVTYRQRIPTIGHHLANRKEKN